jgi:hypothetical protein
MPWKRGNPGRPCCGEPAPQLCLCGHPDSDPKHYHTRFGGDIVAVKLTIEDMGFDGLSWKSGLLATTGWWHIAEYHLSGLKDWEGTYYAPISDGPSTLVSGCVNPFDNTFSFYGQEAQEVGHNPLASLPFVIEWDEWIYTGGGGCTLIAAQSGTINAAMVFHAVYDRRGAD